MRKKKYGLHLDLLSISYWSHVSCPRRRGLIGKAPPPQKNHLRHMYLRYIDDIYPIYT